MYGKREAILLSGRKYSFFKKKHGLKFLNVEINLIDFFFPDVTHPVGNVRYELLTNLQ